jgi:hypothetical protein
MTRPNIEDKALLFLFSFSYNGFSVLKFISKFPEKVCWPWFSFVIKLHGICNRIDVAAKKFTHSSDILFSV